MIMDNVSKKILEDAELERKKIIAQAYEKASAILEEAREKKKTILIENEAKIGEKYKTVYNMELSRAKSQLRQKLLLEKIKLVDKAIEKTKGRLTSLDRDGYIKFLKKSFKSLNVPKGIYQIGKKEKNFGDKLDKLLENFTKSGEEADFEYGLKIIDGKSEYIISAASLIDSDIEDIRMEIASYLFGKEK